MTDPPVWLLDVDGVVNAATKKPDRSVWPADAWIHTHATSNGHRWPILVAQPVVDFIRDVHEQGRAEIRWHTTWQEDANCLADILGLPTLPVQDAPEYGDYFAERRNGWWKLPAALRVVEGEGRPLVWTDDDACPFDLPRAARARLEHTQPTLIVTPSPNSGLTRKHLRKIDAFLTSMAARDGAADVPCPA